MLKELVLCLSLSYPIPVFAKTITATLTAYCACKKCCGQQAKGITASGTKVVPGVIAVDPKVIPLGSEVQIEGKIFFALDTGRAIKGNRIDIYIPSHSQALKFGVKKGIKVTY